MLSRQRWAGRRGHPLSAPIQEPSMPESERKQLPSGFAAPACFALEVVEVEV
ncbi:hypothetical protein PR003_g27700 [Phytophthora rubi]|uniref:Uncharacterized protein n=1 Tax=Phytophthora rubi TaxID=129364 RepID=A0A6A4BXK5_9STRA|nr:hypothetical protein PR003_g27700 [Phytophthora rubi]